MKPNWKTLFFLTTFCTLGLMTTVRAQVSSDGTLSTNVTSPDNLNFTINNGNRVGGNLFHSFREFSVPNGGSAVFQNPLDVQNIINRVTGGSLSQINGLIQSQGSANLFLLNPAGIFFGPNARLNIGGSFFATTADSFLFDNGFEFSATNPQAPPLLTVNIPIGLRFRDNPGNITNQSLFRDNPANITNQSLFPPQVQPGNTLALIGGDVNFDAARLAALGVKVEIGGLKAPGTVGINNDGSLSFPDGVTRGDISFRNGASVDVRFIGGGSITVNGRNVEVSGGSRLDAGIFPGFGMSEAQAGDIVINATDKLTITGTPNFGSTVIANRVGSKAAGNAGDIKITAKNLSLTNSAQINASTFGYGNAGNIDIDAREAVNISGYNIVPFNGTNELFLTGISTSLEQGAVGNGGDINIKAGSLSINDFGFIGNNTSGQGNAGKVSVRVDDAIALANSSQIRSNVEQGGSGIGGDIDIRARSLTLTGGSQIGTALFREGNGLSGGKGRAGNIEINATDFVNIFGVDTGGFSSGLFASAERGTTAISPQAAGNINLTTGDFRIADGAVVNALTSNYGDAGNITINAKTFTASGGGQVITTTSSSGSAGNINLNIRDRITLSGSDPNYNQRLSQAAQFGSPDDIVNNQGAASGIFANTAPNSTGNGGNITIQQEQNSFPRIAIADGGEVTVDSQGQGVGGNLSITGNNLTLDRGIISASTASADGGNIDLSLRNFLRLQNESLISANAGGQQNGGNGGNIRIDTPFIVAFSQNNDIIANARSGSGGQVTTNATLFGIVPRTRADLERLGVRDLNPRNLSTSDITAFSEQNSSFGDNVLVNSPDVDPSRGLVELPETVTDPTQRIAQNPCQQGIGNEFVVTGRGGFPTNPNQTLSSDNVRVDLLQPVASSGNSRSATIKPATNPTATRVPAQGWIFNDKGQVVLTAYDPTNTGSQRPWRTAACPAR